MNYVKAILSGVAAIVAAELIPAMWWFVSGLNRQKATGLAAVAGGLTESLFSFTFWGLFILLFVLFFAASRLEHKALRVLLFWIPTIVISAVGALIFALFGYLIARFGRLG